MARPTDKKLRLKHILVEEAGVEEAVATWIMENEKVPQL